MLYSAAAYCPSFKVRAWEGMGHHCSVGTKKFEVSAAVEASDVTNTREYFGYMGVDHERRWVVAAFKGTNGSVADFATDLAGGYYDSECTVQGVRLGKVHRGFCDYWGSLQASGFGERLASLATSHPGYRVVLTGHSLGAAVAVVAATFLGIRYPAESSGPGRLPPLTVYTFGQPRVGDAAFSDRFAAASPDAWRVVHRKDAVAHEPMCCWNVLGLGGCRRRPGCPYHSAGEVWYSGKGLAEGDESMPDGAYTLCRGAEDPACGNWMALSLPDHLSYFGSNLPALCCYAPPAVAPALAVTEVLLGAGGARHRSERGRAI